MKWVFIIICVVWLLLLLFGFDEDTIKHGIFFVGVMVIYLFVDKVDGN